MQAIGLISGVLDEASPGRFLCGIECDGVAYHSSETARDRDRLRQQVLEARGWTIHRVWSTDWFKDRQGQIHRLLSLIEEARQRAKEELSAEEEARERIATETAALKKEDENARKEEAASILQSTQSIAPYERPIAPPYVFTPTNGYYAVPNFFAVPLGDLVKAVLLVIETESPIHRLDLLTRGLICGALRPVNEFKSEFLAPATPPNAAGLFSEREISTGAFQTRASANYI